MTNPDSFAAGFFVGGLVASALWMFLIFKAIQWHRSISTNNSVTQSADSSFTDEMAYHGNGDAPVESISYRSRNGRSDYRFRIRRLGPRSYRVYVVNQPGYGARDTGDIATHRLRDGTGTYICFTGQIENRAQARALAATWADKTEDYILHGRRF